LYRGGIPTSGVPTSGYTWYKSYSDLFVWVICTVKSGTGKDLEPVLDEWMIKPMRWLENYFENVLPAKLAKANRYAAMSADAERIQAPLDQLYGQLSAKYIEFTESVDASNQVASNQSTECDKAIECKLKIFEEGLEFLDAQLHRCHQQTDPATALAKAAVDEIQKDLYDGFAGKLVASFTGR